MADTIIVGRFVSVTALAAVGATGSVMFLIPGFTQGLTTGFTVMTAQRFTAGVFLWLAYHVLMKRMKKSGRDS